MSLFKQLESLDQGSETALQEILNNLAFNEAGLIPAIAQQFDSGEVLMMAWMNRTALEETLQTKRVCYFSRSRQKLWRKGESSGQIQKLVDIRFDCDGDALLLTVDQTGPACHTGRKSCFFHKAEDNTVKIETAPDVDPKTLYGK